MSEPVTALAGNEALLAERLRRFEDAVALRKPDRVPLMPLALQYFATRIAGVSNRDAGYDHQLRHDCLRDATIRFGWDWAPASGLMPSGSLEAIGAKQVRWPGGGLPDDAPFQWVEDEYLKADEVDDFLADPDGFTMRTLWPRMASAFGVFEQLPLPPLWWFNNAYATLGWSPFLAAPPMRALFEAMVKLSDDAAAFMAATGRFTGEMAALGYPVAYVATTQAPFDAVSDHYRGLRGSTMDLFRQPDKLLTLIDQQLPMMIGQAVGAAMATGNPRVFIPLHRGAAGFLSDEQYAKFYWPGLSALLMALIDAGLTPMPFFEGDYTPRLKYLAELPAGRIAAHFDKVDRAQFKDICGEVLCFWGDLPGSLFVAGTPQQVKDEVKRLIDEFEGRALIIDGSNTLPDEAREENVMALAEAVAESVN
jgi:hypothetical protein